jgi:CRP/FNR family cyclic AMP-dependent transcriptional regulator
MRKVFIFFGILNDEDIEWLASNGILRLTAAGDTLIQEGRSVDAIFLVIDGAFQVTVGSRDVAKLQAGEIVGEMSFVDARPPSASVKALEKSSVLSVPRVKLAEKLERDIAFSARFYRALAVFLAERLRASVSQLGYGTEKPSAEQIEERDELDVNILENLSLASNRFDQLQRRLRSASSTHA